MTVASFLTIKDNRYVWTQGGYLFLCCAMYSSKSSRTANIAARIVRMSDMSITSLRSEGVRYAPSEIEESNRHRLGVPQGFI